MTREEAKDLLDNLIGMVEDNHNSDYDTALRLAIMALDHEPRPGYWIDQKITGLDYITCSKCVSCFLRSHLVSKRYCPNCGAKMRQGEKYMYTFDLITFVIYSILGVGFTALGFVSSILYRRLK